jgi:signal transduction histidine kinase
LETKLAQNLPAIQADAERLEQVLVNILGNAFKFTPAHGAVTVEAFADGAGEDFPALTLTVSDTGTGIPPERIDHVFDKFFQVDSSLSGQNKLGIGLGLAISKGIVEAHGGTIRCSSRLQQGTTFTIGLPIASRRAQPSAGPEHRRINSDAMPRPSASCASGMGSRHRLTPFPARDDRSQRPLENI